MDRIVWVVRIPQTVSNIEISCHDQDVVDVSFSIFEII